MTQIFWVGLTVAPAACLPMRLAPANASWQLIRHVIKRSKKRKHPPGLWSTLGKTTHNLSANDAMWDFFQRHRLPG